MLTVVLAVFQSAYVALGVPPSPIATMIVSCALPFFIVLWVLGDARQQQRTPCFDFGFLVAIGFPLSVAWYVLKTRQLRGLLVLGTFMALYLVPWMCAIALWIVFAVLRGMR